MFALVTEDDYERSVNDRSRYTSAPQNNDKLTPTLKRRSLLVFTQRHVNACMHVANKLDNKNESNYQYVKTA